MVVGIWRKNVPGNIWINVVNVWTYLVFLLILLQVPKSDSAELDVSEVGGMFVILIFGCLLGFLFSLLEFLWNIRKVAVEEKVIVHYLYNWIYILHVEYDDLVKIRDKN